MIPELAFLVALMVANGVFSGAEIAILSARRHRLERLAEQGRPSARVALRLAQSPNDFLSTVQIGITLIGILTGAVGGAGLAKTLEPLLGRIAWLAPYRQGLSFAVVITLITYLSLLIGELVPKRIALADPERLACGAAPAMHWLARRSAPLVSLLSHSTDAVLRLLGVPGGRDQAVSEEEIRALLREGAETGVFEEAEHDMMQRVMRLADRPIKTLMTPRTEISWLDLDEPLERNLAEVMASNHSQFPVARGSLDDCQGVVRVRHLLAARMREEPLDLERMMQPPLFVAESARALTVLEDFRRSGIHLALVSDEYGGVAGLVTLNDLMEGIVGDLPSLEDQDTPQVTRRDDGSWLVDGGLDLQTVNELIGSEIFDLEREGRYHTIAGFVLHVLERIPRETDGFDRHGYRFEVIDMDANRIDKLLITPLPAPATAQPNDQG